MNRPFKSPAASPMPPGICAASGQPVEAGLSTFDLGAGDYIVTPSDFPDGCFVRTINGLRFGTGENKLGIKVTLALDVPLCGGCDTALDAGVCRDCETLFLDVAVTDLGNGWKRAAV